MAAQESITCLVYRGLSTKKTITAWEQSQGYENGATADPEFGDVGDDVILQVSSRTALFSSIVSKHCTSRCYRL